MKNGVAFSLLHSIIHNFRSSAFTNCSIFTACILSPLTLHAQTPATAATNTTEQVTQNRLVDYTPAINELLKLGFPNIQDAKKIKYININDNQLPWKAGGFSFSQNSSYAPKGLTGNGFLIPLSDPEKPSRLIYQGGYETKHIAAKKRTSLFGNSNQNNNIAIGNITEADIKKDLKLITDWVRDFTLHNSYRYNHNQLYTTALGYACIAHQAGHKEEANTLIKTLFLNHQNPEQMIDTLINLLAEKEYLESYTHFQTNKDWQKYYEDLVHLQKKFPRGWKNQPGLSILIPLLEKKLNSEVTFKLPEIEGHTFSEDIKKLLQQTTTPPKNNQYFNTQLFLINPAAKNTSAPAFAQLTQHGMDGFIALTALIGDNTLILPTSIQNRNSYRSNPYRSYHSSDDEITPEAAFAQLQKPQTVGSIALSIIASSLPHDHNDLYELDDQGYKQLAIEWWKEHRNDTRLELIEHYIAMGNSSHTYQLINSMIQENSGETNQLLEKSILASNNPSNFYNSVKIYIKKHKTKASDFTKKYITAVKNEAATNDEYNLNYELRKEEQRNRTFTELLSYTKENDPKKLLKNLAETNENLKQTTELLISTYDGKHISEYINPIIKIVANKKETKHQYQILIALGSNITNNQTTNKSNIDEQKQGGLFSRLLKGHKKAKAKEAAAEKSFILTQEEKVDWEKLIYSEHEIAGYSLATTAGILLDLAAHPKIPNNANQALYKIGKDTANKIITSRAKAILNNTEIPPLPNADNVDKKRYDELIAILEKTDGKQLREVYLTFTLSERLAIMNGEQIRHISQKAKNYILGFSYYSKRFTPQNASNQEEVLKTIIGKKSSVETWLILSKKMMQTPETFNNTIVNISLLPQHIAIGTDILLYNYNAPNSPQIKAAQQDLLDDKIKTFTAASYYDNKSGKQKSIIITEATKLDSPEIAELAQKKHLSFSVLDKSALLKHQEHLKSTKAEREKLLEELRKISPDMESWIDNYTNLTLEQLKSNLEELKFQY